MGKYVLAIDQGTTGTRVIAFDKNLNIVSSHYEEFTQIYPKPGWVEHDPEEIWEKTKKLLGNVVKDVGAQNIVGLGITNQRETTVLWDTETQKPVYNAIVWQCRRTTDICEDLKNKGYEDLFRKKTGLVIDAYFSGTKIKWILDNVDGVREKAKEGKIKFGTIDSWLIYKLTNGKVHATDYTNASRTLIYNIVEKKWDEELCNILNIPMEILPEVKPSRYIYGEVDVEGILKGVPIGGVVGDQQGALFGQGGVNIGDAKNTYGTGCFLLLNIGDTFVESKNGLLTTLASKEDGSPTYALEGSVFIGGAVIQFLRDNLKFFKDAAESEALAMSVDKEDDVYFVPAFVGLGAPYWNMRARGAIYGLTRDTSIAQITRAALRSIAFQSYDVLKAMEEDANVKLKELKVDGGATKNKYLMQFQSDILNIPVVVPENRETTSLGAALLAGLATGFWNNLEEALKYRKIENTFTPQMENSLREKLLSGWKKAIERTLIV